MSKITCVVLLLLVLTAINCSNLLKREKKSHPKNQNSLEETFDSLKEKFSNMSRNLINFEEEAKAEFNKDLTIDQEHKLMRHLGGKLQKMQNDFNDIHRQFHEMADEGKVDQETVQKIDGKFKENQEIKEHIIQIGRQKMAEIRQKTADQSHATSFISREGNMKDLKVQVAEILGDLTNFKKEAHEKFAEKNVADSQEVKIMKDLGYNMEKIEKKAKNLHSIFEDLSKSGEGDATEIKDVEDQFQQVQNKFEVIFAMGEEKIEEIKKAKKGESKKRLRKPSTEEKPSTDEKQNEHKPQNQKPTPEEDDHSADKFTTDGEHFTGLNMPDNYMMDFGDEGMNSGMNPDDSEQHSEVMNPVDSEHFDESKITHNFGIRVPNGEEDAQKEHAFKRETGPNNSTHFEPTFEKHHGNASRPSHELVHNELDDKEINENEHEDENTLTLFGFNGSTEEGKGKGKDLQEDHGKAFKPSKEEYHRVWDVKGDDEDKDDDEHKVEDIDDDEHKVEDKDDDEHKVEDKDDDEHKVEDKDNDEHKVEVKPKHFAMNFTKEFNLKKNLKKK